MPEYPDITVYIERLEQVALGRQLRELRIGHVFLLRTAAPPISELFGRTLTSLERLGKRIVFEFTWGAGAAGEPEALYLVLHLMISGRLHWRQAGASIKAKKDLAALDFEAHSDAPPGVGVPPGVDGAPHSLVISEVATQKRASLHLVKGREALADFARGGLEVMEATLDAFTAALREENHTLKRALTDQRILSGIGNTYSDEILHRARLSPFLQTQKLDPDQMTRLYTATREILTEWTARLRAETGAAFPEKVTAFHPDMAVHGRYGEPCPVCGTTVQRIQYASSETNYCPACQTEGRLLADRGLSRLLKDDWPRTLEELEERKK